MKKFLITVGILMGVALLSLLGSYWYVQSVITAD